MKLCDTEGCVNFLGDECELGFTLTLRLPKNMAEAVYQNWGYRMPGICNKKKVYLKGKVENNADTGRI